MGTGIRTAYIMTADQAVTNTEQITDFPAVVLAKNQKCLIKILCAADNTGGSAADFTPTAGAVVHSRVRAAFGAAAATKTGTLSYTDTAAFPANTWWEVTFACQAGANGATIPILLGASLGNTATIYEGSTCEVTIF